jgi:KRAB domain-containing zinc finger protein
VDVDEIERDLTNDKYVKISLKTECNISVIEQEELKGGHEGEDTNLRPSSPQTKKKCPRCSFETLCNDEMMAHVADDGLVAHRRFQKVPEGPRRFIHGERSNCVEKDKPCNVEQVDSDTSNHLCEQCDYRGQTEDALVVHVRADHMEKTELDKSVNYQNINAPNRLKCKLCDFTARTISGLGRHRKAVHSVKSHKCPHCFYAAAEPNKLNMHIRSTHPEINFVRQSWNNDKNAALIAIHKSGRCPHCNFTSKASSLLKQHIKSVHLYSHVKRVHLEEEESVKSKDYQTVIINEIMCETKIANSHKGGTVSNMTEASPSESGREVRLSRHEVINDIVCEIRNFNADTEFGQLFHETKSLHVQKVGESIQNTGDKTNMEISKDIQTGKVHGVMNKTCPQCNFVAKDPLIYGRSWTLKRHIKTVHAKSQDNKCNHCDFKTTRNDHLINHIKKKHKETWESNEKDPLEVEHHKCDQCSFGTTKKEDLNIHIKTMHLEKEVSNKIRDFNISTTFSDKILNLFHGTTQLPQEREKSGIQETGMEVLKEIKDHKCDQCDYASPSEINLKEHVGKAHKNKSRNKTIFECNQCNIVFQTRFSLKVHTKRMHGTKITKSQKDDGSVSKKTDECDFGSPSESGLKVHKAMIQSEKGESAKSDDDEKEVINECKLCNFTSPTEPSLKKHMEAFHASQSLQHQERRKSIKYEKDEMSVKVSKEMKSHKCNQCNFASPSEMCIMEHIENVHGTKSSTKDTTIFKCKQCNYVFATRVSLKVHAKKIHGTNIAKSQKDGTASNKTNECKSGLKFLSGMNKMCPDCNFIARKPILLKMHINSVHLKLKDQICDMCSFRTARKANLDLHVKRMHSEKGESAKSADDEMEVINEIVCDKCDKTFSTGAGLKTHIGMMHRHQHVLNHGCMKCDLAFSTGTGLKTHIGMMHGHQHVLNVCQHCGHISKTSSQLKNHIKAIHLKTQDNKCDHCDFKTVRKESLTDHMRRMHSEKGELNEEDPLEAEHHSCEQCHFTSTTVHALKVHTGLVHGTKKRHCPHCTFIGASGSRLNRHMLSKHTKTKHKCDLCEYSASLMSSLYDHVRKWHSGELSHWVKCEQCDFVTPKMEYLKTHVGKIHENGDQELEKGSK